MEGEPRPGEVLLEKYRVESVLGRGGMGTVLRVTHLHLGEELAIKVLSVDGTKDTEVNARFLREARAAARLRGEHVARVSDVGVLPQGPPFMVMEYLRGIDLAGELLRRGPLAPGEVADYMLQACEALAEAHAHGIVHRDIKPANLFLTTRPDGTPLVKVLDFGISKAPITTAGAPTRTDMVMGTAGYMSPEQMKASRDVDARTDIWALGIVLYECLNGRRPFEGESYSAVVLLAGTEPPPPMDPRIPRALQAVVLRCLEKDRRARYGSIAELAGALAPFARDQRAASTVVDRTSNMQRRAASEPAVPGESMPTQRLAGGATAGGTPATSRRGALVVLAAVVGVIGVVSGVAVIASRPTDGRGVGPGTPEAGSVVVASALDASRDREAPLATAHDAASSEIDAPTTPGQGSEGTQSGQDGPQILASCVELNAQRRWQGLRDCADQLEKLGAVDQARGFKVTAIQETANEQTDAKARQALRDGALVEAQKLLRGMTTDSVYHKALSEQFERADATNADEVRRRAQDYVNSHDCSGLRKFLGQQTRSGSATGTDKAIAVVRDALARCQEKAGANRGRTDHGPGSAVASGNGSATSTTAPPAEPARPCDSTNVDDLMAQAQRQYSNGFAAAAFSQMSQALRCKQTVRMYQLAALYACAAHDLANAKLYFGKLSPGQQPPIEQRCSQEGLNIRAP